MKNQSTSVCGAIVAHVTGQVSRVAVAGVPFGSFGSPAGGRKVTRGPPVTAAAASSRP